jgi:selenide, water dikinase
VGPGALAHVLRQLPRPTDPRLIVGIDTADDAGVYRLDDETALIQTLDFFTPIVDDPYTFGQIAAANSLSDVYAMGGRPLTAMNIVAFPMCSMDNQVLLAILQGGQAKVSEAGAVIAGGHTIEDAEPKYGLSVTGIVHPDKIWTNANSRPGDLLILTKPLGTGILATAARAEMFADGVAAAELSMLTLNKAAAETAARFTVHACTDVTGFGLLGHLSEMAVASGTDIEIDSLSLPVLPEALEAAQMGLVPAGAYANRDYLTAVAIKSTVAGNLRDICFDPQTSGGLILSLPEDEAEQALTALIAAGVSAAAIIGRVREKGGGKIYVY